MSKNVELLGVFSPSMAAVAEPQPGMPSLPRMILPGAITGLLGVAVWKKHPLLGFLGGETVGMNAMRLFRGHGVDRAMALSNLAMTGTAIAGSLAWRKHPVFGFFAGMLAGAVVTSMVPGSNAFEYRKKYL